MSEPTIPMDEKATFKAFDDLALMVGHINLASDPRNIDRHFEQLRAETETEVTIKGVRIKDANSIIDEVDHKKCEEYDADIRRAAAKTLKDWAALEQGMDEQAKAAGTLKPPMPTLQTERWLATIAYNTERQELRALARGWSRQQLVNYYETLSDKDSPALVAFIEAEAAANFPTVEMKGHDSDVAATQQLTKLIAARREARTPLHVQEVRLRLSASLGRSKRLLLQTLSKPNSSPALHHRFVPNSNTRKSQRQEGSTAI